MYLSLLLLGFLLGIRHAVEADHIAAVASLSANNPGIKSTIRQGAMWGLGHTITLFVFGSLALLVDSIIPGPFAAALEFAVGVMLVVLGFDVIIRLYRKRVHFHVHQHNGEVQHLHAHSHYSDVPHKLSPHRHEHAAGFPRRALLVGLMHGMAGSATLILLTLQTVDSPFTGLAYMACFGIGSMAGMALLSAIIAVPLCYSAKRNTLLFNGLSIVVAAVTAGIGATMVMTYLQSAL